MIFLIAISLREYTTFIRSIFDGGKNLYYSSHFYREENTLYLSFGNTIYQRKINSLVLWYDILSYLFKRSS